MTLDALAAIHVFRIRTVYVPLRLIGFVAVGTVSLVAGVLFGSGIIRGGTYVGCIAALAVLLVVLTLGTAGAYFFLRSVR